MQYSDVIGIEAVKERFMGNYAMFSKYLYQFADGTIFQALEQALKAGNIIEAFDAAHNMKGVVLNLSLRRLEQLVVPIVEALRSGAFPNKESWNAFQGEYTLTQQWIESLKEEGTVLF